MKPFFLLNWHKFLKSHFDKYSTRIVMTWQLNRQTSGTYSRGPKLFWPKDHGQVSFCYFSYCWSAIFLPNFLHFKLNFLLQLSYDYTKIIPTYIKKHLLNKWVFKKKWVEVWLPWSKILLTKGSRLIFYQVQMLIWLQ